MHFYKICRHFLLCSLLCFVASALSAQNYNPDGYGFELNYMRGNVLKHSAKFTLPLPQYSQAIDFAYVHQTDGRNAWEQRRHYPLLGFGFTYTSYGIDSVYGKCFGVYPMLQLPIIRGKHLEWTARLGMGIGYVTKRYSRAPDFDTLNDAIGSHINNFTLFMTDLRYHVNKHLDIQIGGNFSHISNGALKQPNLGVNMYGAHIGIRYFPTTSDPVKIKRELPVPNHRLLFQTRTGIAFKENGLSGGALYRVYLASAYASYRYHGKNKVFLGVDYSYHENIYAFLRNNEVVPGHEAAHSWKSAVFFGNEWSFGRGAIFVQAGIYIKQAYIRQDPYYEKLGYMHYFLRQEKGVLKEFFVYGALKAHQAVAELGEFGIGTGF